MTWLLIRHSFRFHQHSLAPLLIATVASGSIRLSLDDGSHPPPPSLHHQTCGATTEVQAGWLHDPIRSWLPPLAIRAGERKRVRASAPLRLPQSPTIPDSADLSLNPLLSTKTPRCTHPYQGWLRHATQTCQCKLSSRGDNREVANPCDPPLFAPASCHTGTDYGADMLFFTDGCR